MNKTIEFGETVKGYDSPVLNEREIRASAGILFLVMFVSWMQVIFKDNFVPIKYAIIMFFMDFVIRIFIKPKYSPTLILGRFIVRKQIPEYAGAAQKRFAWIIGLALSAIMVLHMVVLNAYSFITGIICLTCLTFLFFESAFGICLGCKFYWLLRKGKPRYCPGDACEAGLKHDIQKISLTQSIVLIGFIGLILFIPNALNGYLGEKPRELFEVLKSAGIIK